MYLFIWTMMEGTFKNLVKRKLCELFDFKRINWLICGSPHLVLLGSVLASSDINEPTGVPWFITGDAALRTFKSLETIPFQKGGSAAVTVEGFQKYGNVLRELLVISYVQDNSYKSYNCHWKRFKCNKCGRIHCCFGTWPVSLHLSIVHGHKTAFSCSNKEEGIAIFECEEVRE